MTKTIAYVEGWNSAPIAYTGGNPYQGRAGQQDWQQGRDDARRAWALERQKAE